MRTEAEKEVERLRFMEELAQIRAEEEEKVRDKKRVRQHAAQPVRAHFLHTFALEPWPVLRRNRASGRRILQRKCRICNLQSDAIAASESCDVFSGDGKHEILAVRSIFEVRRNGSEYALAVFARC